VELEAVGTVGREGKVEVRIGLDAGNRVGVTSLILPLVLLALVEEVMGRRVEEWAASLPGVDAAAAGGEGWGTVFPLMLPADVASAARLFRLPLTLT